MDTSFKRIININFTECSSKRISEIIWTNKWTNERTN